MQQKFDNWISYGKVRISLDAMIKNKMQQKLTTGDIWWSLVFLLLVSCLFWSPMFCEGCNALILSFLFLCLWCFYLLFSSNKIYQLLKNNEINTLKWQLVKILFFYHFIKFNFAWSLWWNHTILLISKELHRCMQNIAVNFIWDLISVSL